MSHLQVTCLGDFQVRLAGETLTTFQTDKVRALLVYLAVESEAQPRPALAQLLWPGYSATSATNSLRQTLHRLRQLLHDATADPPWLLITRQTVQLNPAAPLQVDVTTFTQWLAAPKAHGHDRLAACPACVVRLRQAVDLYQGDFLAGFTVADSDPFEEWRRLRQEQLHLQTLAALSQLAEAAEASGDTEQALRDAHRQLALEPWLEVAHRRIMRLLAQRGQRAAALAQYQRCRQVLAEELGTEPEAETTALAEQIQRGRFDKETGRQGEGETRRGGDKERQESPVSLSPVSLSPVSLSPIPPSPPHNLPAALTPFVGRTRALAEINSRLAAARLLTLVGPGGMGKTRLALEVGRQQLAAYPDGVFFVALAALTDPAAIAPAIAASLAATLGAPVQGDPVSALYQFLQPRRLLLILDNFEHLLAGSSAGVELIIGLLQAAPGMRILATSRERLQVRGEQLYPVQPFTVAANASLAEAAASSAARLFVQSAQFVQADFQLTAANLMLVLRICQLVQGMPLGLELAAAQVGTLPLQTIAAEIAQSAEFLQADWHDMPERQRSMRAVFAWSWQLLNDTEQRALRQIAIFRGGFTREAAQTVTGVTFPTLARLAHRSLIYWTEGQDADGRYMIHELLRQFAAEQLAATPAEWTLAAARHSAYYLAFVAEREKRLTHQDPRQAADEIQNELNNIRQAWTWAATNQATDEGQQSEALGQAAYSLWEFYDLRGPRAEAEQILRFALQQATLRQERTASAPQALPRFQAAVSKLLALHALTLVVQGQHDDAAATARQAITLGQTHGGWEGELIGMAALAQALAYLNRTAEARDGFEATLQLARRYRSAHLSSAVLVHFEIMASEYLAYITLDAGDAPRSREYMVQSLQTCQTIGRRLVEQHCLYVLGYLDHMSGDYATAQREYAAALALAQTLGHQTGEMYTMSGIGEVLRLQCDYQSAHTVLTQGLNLARTLNDVSCQALTLISLSRLDCQLGNATGAAAWVAQLSQLMATSTFLPEHSTCSLGVFAFHAQFLGQAEQALAYAEQAWQIGQAVTGTAAQEVFIMLGHAHSDLGHWAAAAEAYTKSSARYSKLGNHAVATEARAGLAQSALAQGDLVGAQAQVEAILPILAKHTHIGFNGPFFVYWTCYRVLTATGDARAATVLQQGYVFLQQVAALLDEETRRCFLEAVAINRALVAAYVESCSALQSA